MARLLGIDLGTTSFKAVIYDEYGNALASPRTPPLDEQVKVNGFRLTVCRPEKLWEAIYALIREAVSQLPVRAIDVLAIVVLGLVGYLVVSKFWMRLETQQVGESVLVRSTACHGPLRDATLSRWCVLKDAFF
jgi:ribulose kinase